MQRPFPAYQGDDPYVFICYARSDAAQVYPELVWLNEQGCNIWYDEGISPGSDWTEALASSIERANAFIFFGSPASAVSKHCVAEIAYAIDNDIPIIAIYLEETLLSGGMKLRLNTHQAILMYQLDRGQYESTLMRGLSPMLASGVSAPPAPARAQAKKPTRKSVAVVPFSNRSRDSSSEEIGDAIADDLITALSRFEELDLAGRVASFALKGEPNLDYRMIGNRLGVRYVVSGTIQKSGDRIRIHVQLDEVESGHNVWSSRFDRTLDDIFELQDDIVSKVIDALLHSGELELGQLVGERFLIDEVWKVGSGGLGDVYKALDLLKKNQGSAQPYVALRLLNEAFSASNDALRLLRDSMGRVSEIAHRNIMATYLVEKDAARVFLVFELLEGQPLDNYLQSLQSETLGHDKAMEIIDGITRGLATAHSGNIVHGDIKPGNIFYTSDSTPKLFDFSLTEAASAALPDNQWAFTPAYASCERCETGIASFADDVYATAVVAYELLSGQHPFHRTPSLKAHNQGMKAKRIDVLSDRQWQTLQQALAFDPERRLPSIAAFREGILP